MSTAYVSGLTTEGTPILAGLWRMKDEMGFPVSCFLDETTARGFHVDWLEAMADASMTDNLPALMREIEMLLTHEKVDRLKAGFVLAVKNNTYSEILEKKKENAKALKTYFNEHASR